jgi:hypothetical protein
MDQKYLFTPVIKVQDGEELKSYRLYYLFVVALLGGIIPSLILCVKNCFWLRAKKAALILAVVSLGLLIAKYQVLGDYYHAHSTVLKDFFHYYRQTEQLQAKPEGIINEQIMQTVTKYVQGQKIFAALEKLWAILMVLVVYLVCKNNYQVVLHLNGNIQPILGWAIGTILLALVFENAISNLFFGGTLI